MSEFCRSAVGYGTRLRIRGQGEIGKARSRRYGCINILVVAWLCKLYQRLSPGKTNCAKTTRICPHTGIGSQKGTSNDWVC